MKVAICQSNIVWEDKVTNYKNAKNFINEAAEQTTDSILFP